MSKSAAPVMSGDAAQIRALLQLCLWFTWAGAAMTWLLAIWPASSDGLMPSGLPFPLPLHAALIIVPALIVLVFDRYLASRPILTLPLLGLLAATSAGIELFGSLTQIGTAIVGFIAPAQPDPISIFLDSVGGPDILLYALLVIVFVNTTSAGLECLRLVRRAHLTIIPIRILLIYSFVRPYFGLAQPIGQTDPARTIVDLAITVLAGLALAVLLHRCPPAPAAVSAGQENHRE
ncbi:MAG: hypothetical protein AB7R87_11520 [Parvibaculaceae bacterium]